MNLATISPLLFVAAAFTLATILDPIWSGMPRREAKSVIDLAVGDGKRLFANHFVSKADVYFHNGYYPTIFQQAKEESHLTASAESHDGAGHDEHHDDHANETPEEHAKHAGQPDEHGHHEGETPEEHAKHSGANPGDQPQDFLEAFGRHFFVSQHSHMKNADAKELLPWFKIAAELDPTRIETYTVTAFWLRTELKRVNEAEEFLREGWKANPDSYAIIFELGRLYENDRKDDQRARNLFEIALKKWNAQESQKEKPDMFGLEQILANLVETEYRLGDYRACLQHLEQLAPISPYPETIRKHIGDVKAKLAGSGS
jgi:tetratricopeptide (TPR) repeat protein